MKAVLAHRLPPGHVVDLTHELPPHAIVEAAFLLRQMAGGFPPGTVHVAVVDPGVGGARQRLVVACADGSRLVGPDNGVLAPLAARLGGGSAYALDLARLDLGHPPSATFEGRDVFAPTAAALARGAEPSRLGAPVEMQPLELPLPIREPGAVRGTVLHVDRFGNLITNIPGEWLPQGAVYAELSVGEASPRAVPVVRTYASLALAGVGVLTSSFGTLEVSVREGSAAAQLGAHAGAGIGLTWRSGRPWTPRRPTRSAPIPSTARRRSQDGK
jgi:S-adenosyl-L-methionine hydrolase (adenosine-forming)